MSSNGFALTLDIRPRPSRQLLLAVVGVHGLAAAAPLLWIPQWPAKLLLTLAVVVSLVIALRRHRPGDASGKIYRVIWAGSGEMRAFLRGVAEPQPVDLLPVSVVTRFIVILHLKLQDSGARRSMVLCSDSLDSTTWRRLRARLRLQAVHGDEVVAS